MIAIDTNVLIYAHREDSEWHERAEHAVRELAEGAGAWAIPWPCVHEFLAIATHPRIFRTPTPIPAALDQLDAWFESPSVVTLAEDDDYWATLRVLIGQARIDGPRVHDARVAALCLRHGVRELWTADRDFSLFPTLRVRNPLVG
ncbi:MAG: toxin PIN [Acidobacteria bacterium RIFCSPLOWO2_02_FULL_68_18]|nr:MAG: toxin PIN [Acidobacteria bacterium RIFCSPLOWO2_02_FULL_68_18]OFW52172.1 MAG: toxin PIN [Acidobacteria bacterium RIFCSPLOWO2_12_FULL_68_19]